MAQQKKSGVRKKKRERLNVESGQAHIQASFNNTIVTITEGLQEVHSFRCSDGS